MDTEVHQPPPLPPAGSKPKAPPPPPVKPPASEEELAPIRESLWFGDEDPALVMLHAEHTTAARSAIVEGLKPFPVVAMQTASLLLKPDFKMVEVRASLERDPALATRVLRVVNSPVYRTSSPCASLEQAVMRLGVTQTREILIGAATMGLFQDVGGVGGRFRSHAAGVAAIARVLAVEWRYGGIQDVFLSALMHDLGKLLLVQAGEFPYHQLDPQTLEKPDEVHLHERLARGFDHAALGAVVLEAWGFPLEVVGAVAFHHQPAIAFRRGGNLGLVVALVRMADRLEYSIARCDLPDEELLDEIAKDGSASYVDFSADILRAMWPKLAAARGEVAAALE